MRIFNQLSVLALLTVLSGAPTAPRAATGDSEPAESEELADTSFSTLVEEAQSAYKKEAYDRAIRLLVRAYSRRPNARLLFNIAKSHEKKEQCATALVYYRAYVNHPGTEKKLMDEAEKKMEMASDCDGYSEDLAGRLVVGTTPEGARVYVDGQLHGLTPTEVAPLEAGNHKLEIKKEGYRPVSIDLSMDSGKKTEINQILQEKSDKRAQAAQKQGGDGSGEQSTESTRSSPFWPIHPGAIALGAGGVGGLTVGTVYDLVLIPSTDDERRRVARGSDEFQRLTDERETEATIALIGYIGGGVLLTSGIIWHAVDVASEPTPASQEAAGRSPQLSWGVSPQSVRLQVQFH